MDIFFRWARLSLLALCAACAGGGLAPACAQELSFTFRDPSFGGNPFYSTHLLGIAELSRPAQPSTATSPEDLVASQLRAQLTSSLSANILSTIQAAKPGDSGTFTVGNQQISYARTATQTTVTFTNAKTGETSQLVIPGASSAVATPFSASTSPVLTGQSLGTSAVSAEQALMAQSAAAPLPVTPVISSPSGLEVSLAPAPL